MADLDYDHFDGGYPAASNGHYGPGRYGRGAQMVGAAVSLALVLGAGLWGYQIAMRDVTGIPVIRAAGGAMRLAPANPGGQQTLHQGLSVNAVAAAGTALPLPETLVLAPKPMDLAEEDKPGLEPLEPAGSVAAETAAPMTAAPTEQVAEAPVDAVEAPVETLAPIEASAMPEALPATQEDAVAAALAEALGLEPEAVASASDDPAMVANLEGVTPTMAPATEIDPGSIASGTLLVQLGAFDNQDDARSEWTRLSGQFAELMAGKALVIQPAQSGGKTFYRLRAHGFQGDDDTRRFCTAMLAENATCIPVAQR